MDRTGQMIFIVFDFLICYDAAFNIPVKPLHNHDIVSVHSNNFYCMGICNKLSRHLHMLT